MEKNNRNSDWFEIRKGDDTVYAFCEHKHAQWVHSFLILGEKRSVLFDTGLGVCNIEEAIGPHLKTPLLVVNSHAHFDHIGNNWRFPEVYGHITDFSGKIAREGVSHEKLEGQFDECNFSGGWPDGFDGSTFAIPPYTLKPLGDGEKIDLGDRSLEVLYCPGHSDDGIMLWDEQTGNLFTGDSYYSGGLYLYFDDDVYGKSDIKAYYDAITHITEHCKDIRKLCVSHNPDAFHEGSSQLIELHQGLEELMDGKLTPEPVDLPCGDSYYIGGGKRAVLPHCSIIYR